MEDIAVTLGLLGMIYAMGFWCAAMLDLPTRKIIWWPIALVWGFAKTLRLMIWTERK